MKLSLFSLSYKATGEPGSRTQLSKQNRSPPFGRFRTHVGLVRGRPQPLCELTSIQVELEQPPLLTASLGWGMAWPPSPTRLFCHPSLHGCPGSWRRGGHLLSIPLQEPRCQLINKDCLPVHATDPSSTIWSPGADIKSQFLPGCHTPVSDNIKPPPPKGGFKIKAAKGWRCLCCQTSLRCRGTADTESCAPWEAAQLQAWHCYWNHLHSARG